MVQQKQRGIVARKHHDGERENSMKANGLENAETLPRKVFGGKHIGIGEAS